MTKSKFQLVGSLLRPADLRKYKDEIDSILAIFNIIQHPHKFLAAFYILTGMSFIRIFSYNLHILKFCIFLKLILLCIQAVTVNLNCCWYTSIYVTFCFLFQYIHSLYCGKIKVGFFNSVAITGAYLDIP